MTNAQTAALPADPVYLAIENYKFCREACDARALHDERMRCRKKTPEMAAAVDAVRAARLALAGTGPTTPAGLAVWTAFVDSETDNGEILFDEGEEVCTFIRTLASAAKVLAVRTSVGLPPIDDDIATDLTTVQARLDEIRNAIALCGVTILGISSAGITDRDAFSGLRNLLDAQRNGLDDIAEKIGKIRGEPAPDAAAEAGASEAA